MTLLKLNGLLLSIALIRKLEPHTEVHLSDELGVGLRAMKVRKRIRKGMVCYTQHARMAVDFGFIL